MPSVGYYKFGPFGMVSVLAFWDNDICLAFINKTGINNVNLNKKWKSAYGIFYDYLVYIFPGFPNFATKFLP